MQCNHGISLTDEATKWESMPRRKVWNLQTVKDHFLPPFLQARRCVISMGVTVWWISFTNFLSTPNLFFFCVWKNTTCVRHLLFHLAIRSSCKRSRNKESIYQTPFYKSCTNFLHRAFLSFRWQFTFVITVRNRQYVPSSCTKRNSFDREC